MIRLIGPGGAGKSTVGAVLAHLLACPFLDLDRSFAEQHGDIDRFGTYVSVPAPKIETMRPPAEVAAEIVARLPPNLAVP